MPTAIATATVITVAHTRREARAVLTAARVPGAPNRPASAVTPRTSGPVRAKHSSRPDAPNTAPAMMAVRPGTDVASTHDTEIPTSPPTAATATTGRDRGLSTSPPAADIAAWLARKPSIADITVAGNTVSSSNRNVALDFGGYLKGVALDRAAAILRAQGINNALINIGGNIMALGSKEGKKWRVGIQHPRQSGPLATVTLNDGEAIGTSGDYQRFFEVDGKRYAHLLDPRTGYPADHTQAVTVLVPPGPRAGTLSDATSKPIFIAGPEQWREMARKMDIGLVLRVDRDNRIFVTEALRQRLEFVGKAPEMTVVP